MATRVFKNAMIIVNGVNLSAHIQSLALSYEAESLDETAMGNDSRKKRGGLKNHGIDVTFFQNSSCVEATLFSLVGCQTSVEVRACNACSTGDTNPRYQATYMIPSCPPMGGAVGDLMTAQIRFEPAGDLSRNSADT